MKLWENTQNCSKKYFGSVNYTKSFSRLDAMLKYYNRFLLGLKTMLLENHSVFCYGNSYFLLTKSSYL